MRKYTGEPYTVHLQAVADLVQTHGGTPEMIGAAFLHDVVEDTGITIEYVRFMFGPVIGDFVDQLTDTSRPEDGNRDARKAIDRAHTAKASPAAKTIKLADLIDNTRSIVEHDPKFAKVYLAEKRLLLEVLREGDAVLWNMAKDMVDGFSCS
jgi:(p)ppGpp synthase/HD superfamily hydrolase